MLSTIFIYIKNLQEKHTQKNFIPEQFKSLYHSLRKHNITPYFLLPSNVTTFSYPKVDFDLHIMDCTSILHFFSNTFKNLKIKKEHILIVSDCKEILSFGKTMNVPCVGYMSDREFLPVSHCFESFENLSYSYFVNIWKRFYHFPITISNTKNLKIREFTAEDIPAVFSLHQDVHNTRFLFQQENDYTNFYEKYYAYIKEVYPFYDYGLWAVVHKETGKLIGEFGLQSNVIDNQEEIELGYLLHPSFQGKGLATEAIRSIFRYAKAKLGFQRIVAIIHPNNTPSLQTALRCGMHLERKNFFHGKDACLYAIDLKTDTFFPKQIKANQIGKKVYNLYQAKTDTSVYGKRYKQTK